MRRFGPAVEAFAGGVLAAGLLAGCSEAPPIPDTPDIQRVTVAPTPGQEMVIQPPSAMHVANLGAISLNTVEISASEGRVELVSPDGTVTTREVGLGLGTGEVVRYGGATFIVTAAHVAAPGSTHCSDTTVSVPGAGGEHVPYIAMPEKGNPAETAASAKTLNDYNGGHDMAVLQGSAFGEDIPTPFVVSDLQTLKVGDHVAAFGYGPRKDIDPNPLDGDALQSRPVQVDGTVVAVSDGKANIITGTVQKVGQDGLKAVRHGDSGGPVVNAKGQYIGEAIALPFLDRLLTAAEIDNYFHVRVAGDQQARYSVATIQLVTGQDMRRMLGNLHDCTSKPPVRVTTFGK